MKTNFKILSITALALISLQSCEKKKNQPADQLVVSNDIPQVDPNAALVTETKSHPITNLVLSEDTFDFGTIKKGEVKHHTYEVTNTGKNPLIISEVKPGCGCTIPDFTKDPILPGQKGQITLKFESEGFDGAVHKTAQVFANVAKTPITINFTANIK